MGDTLDVVICGAGAAGLTLAIELARRGVAFRLVEQREQPFHGSRGKGIQPRSQEIFEDMGIVDRLFAAGGLYPVSRSHHADGTCTDAAVIEAAPATPAEPYRQPLMVPQFLTEAVMRDRLAELGHRVEFGHAVIGLEQDANGVTVRLATPTREQTVRTRYLVGADGGRSFVRQALDIGFPGTTLGVRAVVADIVLHGLPRDAWHSYNEDDPQRRISLCPLMGTALFQLQAPVPLDGDVDLSVDGLADMVRVRTGRNDLAVLDVCWASAYRMNARLADRYRDGRVFLIGDAAHTHPPTGGQGLNTSVQDAYNLGWKLAAVLKGRRRPCWIPTSKSAAPLQPRCSGLPRRCSPRPSAATTAAGATSSSSISPMVNRHSRCLPRPAADASRRATGRRMRRCRARVDSACACSTCCAERIGHCWVTKRTAAQHRRERGCMSISSATAAICAIPRPASPMRMDCTRVTGC